MKENMNCEPLLFIETVNNNDVTPKNQSVYDSRFPSEKPIMTKTHESEFYIKISRLVLMYNKNKKIICKLLLLNKEEYTVIVVSTINNILNCINVDNNEKMSFNINEIDELTIEVIY